MTFSNTETHKLPDIMERYIEFRTETDEVAPEDSQFCSDVGISVDKLQVLKKENPDWMRQVLQKRRDSYILRLMEVDDGLFRKAVAGDVKAVELIYERWENYVRKKQTGTNVAVNVTLAGLIRSANRPDEQNTRGREQAGHHNRVAGAF